MTARAPGPSSGRRRGPPTAARHVSLQVDRDGRITDSQPPSALDVFGRRASDVVGKFACDLFVADDVLTALALVHRASRDGTADAVLLRLRVADDGEIVTRVTAHGSNGRVNVRIRTGTESEREMFRTTAAVRARFDPLTGLRNRLLLLEDARRAVARAAHTLVLVDIDRFRHLVTVLGTRTGDRILVEVADRLVATSGPGGIVGLSGGQFAMLVPGVRDEHAIAALLANVHAAIAVPFEASGDEIQLSACLGVARAPRATDDVEGLFADAEVALAQAKSIGPARDTIFDPALRRRAVHQIEVQSELSRAVADNELRLDFQPIVDLVADTVMGYEALVRWQHPNRGLLAPRDFLGIAQRTGAGAAIDDWVLTEACGRTAERVGSGYARSICVNVAPERFATPGFVARVEEVLTTTGLEPSRLVLEITEWGLLADLEAACATLAALNDLGVRVALDDYGTGYSSLADVASLAVDEIKIDTTFVAGLGTDRARTAIVHAIVGLGHALDITVVAEGVETAQQAFSLRALGCEFGQGFHFGRPGPYPKHLAGKT